MTDYASILSAAAQLPQSDQLRLIDELWGADASPLSDEWLAEIQRRSQEIDSGAVRTIPWETVREAAVERLGSQREG